MDHIEISLLKFSSIDICIVLKLCVIQVALVRAFCTGTLCNWHALVEGISVSYQSGIQLITIDTV